MRASASTTFFLPFLGLVSVRSKECTNTKIGQGKKVINIKTCKEWVWRSRRRTDDFDEKLERLGHADALHEVLGTTLGVGGPHRRDKFELEQLDQVVKSTGGQRVLNALALLHGQLPQDVHAVPVLLPRVLLCHPKRSAKKKDGKREMFSSEQRLTIVRWP